MAELGWSVVLGESPLDRGSQFVPVPVPCSDLLAARLPVWDTLVKTLSGEDCRLDLRSIDHVPCLEVQ